MKHLFRSRTLFAALAVLFLLHLGYLYVKVGTGLARDAWEVPSILYGRPAAIRPGDLVDNLRISDRLGRLSYRKVKGTPETPGTWSEENDRIRIHTRGFEAGEASRPGVRAEIGIAERRIVSLKTLSGAPLEELVLEPEEIARILGPKMESRRMVPLNAVPDHFRNAVLAAEDSRFYSHFGIDLIGVDHAIRRELALEVGNDGLRVSRQIGDLLLGVDPERSVGRDPGGLFRVAIELLREEIERLVQLPEEPGELLVGLDVLEIGLEGPRPPFHGREFHPDPDGPLLGNRISKGRDVLAKEVLHLVVARELPTHLGELVDLQDEGFCAGLALPSIGQ